MNPIDLIMDWNAIAAVTTAWVLTYALHSVLLQGGVWVAVRRGWVESPLLETHLWKGVLVAGLLTATLQVGAGWGPEIYRLNGAADGPEEPRVAEITQVHVAQYRSASGFERRAAVETSAGTLYRTAEPPSEASSFLGTVWAGGPGGFVLLWILGAAGLGGWWAARHAAFRWKLRERILLEEGPAVDLLEQVCGEAGIQRSVRLSRSEAIEAPVLLDEREICVPGRFFEELTRPQQRLVLAHEIGHLRNRDRSWTAFALALESLFFFQPFHRIARRRVQARSEERADRWAARTGAERCDLAEVLLTVARWVRGGASSDLAPTVYRDGSELERRIRRLVGSEPDESAPRSRMIAGLAVTSLALLVACAGPRVANEATDLEAETPETATVETVDAPPAPPELRVDRPEIRHREPPAVVVRPDGRAAIDTTRCPCSPDARAALDRARAAMEPRARAALDRARAAMEEARIHVQALPLDSIVEAAMREAEIEMKRFHLLPPPDVPPVPESYFEMHREHLEEARDHLRRELDRLERLEREFEEKR